MTGMSVDSHEGEKDRFDKEKKYWEKFQEALTGKELTIFVDLIEKAEKHKKEINKVSDLRTFQAFVMSIILEKEKEIQDLEEKINRIKNRLER